MQPSFESRTPGCKIRRPEGRGRAGRLPGGTKPAPGIIPASAASRPRGARAQLASRPSTPPQGLCPPLAPHPRPGLPTRTPQPDAPGLPTKRRAAQNAHLLAPASPPLLSQRQNPGKDGRAEDKEQLHTPLQQRGPFLGQTRAILWENAGRMRSQCPFS